MTAARAADTPVRWHRSVAVKSFGIAFVATHIPLLALVAAVTLAPGVLPPLGVLAIALVATLAATVLVITVLWRLFRPLRQAADGLHAYMTRGTPWRGDTDSGTTSAASDEVTRLVQVLVHALAHIDRARSPLLQAGANVLQGRTGLSGVADGEPVRTLGLIEIDQWQQLDQAASLEQMMEVQTAMARMLNHQMQAGEVMLPWGRGRYLVILNEPPSGMEGRLWPLLRGFRAGPTGTPYSCSVAMEPHGAARSWPASLQRLDHKLFALRSEGRTACVA